MPQIILAYPIWFVAFCVLLGILYSGGLYYKSGRFKESSRIWVYVMAFLRFFVVCLLSFFLLSPSVKKKSNENIQPVTIFLQDNSESISLFMDNEDSLYFKENWQTLVNRVSEKYPTYHYTFGESVSLNGQLSFSEEKTNLSASLEQIASLYQQQHVGAVVLASDGLYNEGSNPYYTEFPFPLYVLGLGNTNPQTDLKIRQVNHSKIVYLDDEVQVKVVVQADHLQGKSTIARLYHNTTGQKTFISEQSVSFDEEYEEHTIIFYVSANEVGVSHYTVLLDEIENEITYKNNVSDFFIDVIDGRQKILLLANAPHPDIAMIRSVAGANKNHELTVEYINTFSTDVDEYDLIILHQLPSFDNPIPTLINSVNKLKIPVWYIAGVATDYNRLNQCQAIVNSNVQQNKTEEATPVMHPSFQLFSISNDASEIIKKLPPVIVPYGTYTSGVQSQPLFSQQIGAVETDFPLWVFNSHTDHRQALFLGDGLWRWRQINYATYGNQEIINEWIEKTMVYLALKEDRRQFIVHLPTHLFVENESVYMEAELYNENYERINDPEISIQVTDDEGKNYPLSFSRTRDFYQLSTTQLPVGRYQYVASVVYNEKKQVAEGAFIIQPLQVEALQTKANHELLAQLAQKTGGAFFELSDVDSLQEKVHSLDIKPITYTTQKTRPLLTYVWVVALLFLFLSVEWFLRKYTGSY